MVGNDYEGVNKEWNYLLEDLQVAGIPNRSHGQRRERPHPHRRATSFVRSFSGQVPHKIAQEAPLLILGCEIAKSGYNVYDRIRLRQSMRKAKVLMSGTFETGQTWYHDKFDVWQLAGWKRTPSPSRCPHGRTAPSTLAAGKTPKS